LELAKLPEPDSKSEDPLLDWLQFMNSDEVDEMEAVAQRNMNVRSAVDKYKQLISNEQERILAEAAEHQRRIKVGQINFAKDEGLAEGIKKGEARGIKKGRAEGEARGIKKGRAEGLAKGEARAKSAIAKELAARGMSEKEISEILK
jgi:flagellar biosynthesis/type III secretory pathway protein FliH